MIFTPTRFLVAATVILASAAPAQQKPSNLDTVLHQLDVASANFKSAQANFRWDVYQRVVRETTSQCGVIYFERHGDATEMGAKVAPTATQSCSGEAAATANGTRTLAYKSGELQMFEPGTNHLTILHAGNNQAQYESFLTLGFGGSGRDLAKAWTITDQGTETINGTPTEKLDLVSKDDSVRNMFTHVTIWIDAVRGLSLKQQFFAPNGDTRTATYSNIKLNASINKKPYDISKSDQRIQH